MNKTLLVARHEFLVTAANKAFVAITLLGPILILAVSVLPGLLATSSVASAGSVVAVVGGDGDRDGGIAASMSAALAEGKSRAEAVPDEAVARGGVLSGRYSAAVILPSDWTTADQVTLLVKTGTDYILYSRVGSAVDALSREARAAASGIDPAAIRKVLKSPRLDVQQLGKKESGSHGGADAYLGILFTVLAFVMLMYMTVLLYGQLIGRSVLQEKSNKTVEIMLSSVSSRELMAGKILGPGLAGLIQYAFWIVVALGGIKVLGPSLHIAMPSALTAGNLFWLVAFFLPAYFLYSSIYAALGAGAEDEQHLTQLAWPLLLFLMVPIFLINLLLSNPDSTISAILSYFPLTSPIVMLIRILVSPPALWKIGVSYALLLVSVWAAVLFSAKVFRIGVLMTGKKRKLGEIIRWVFEK
jgi:ABC-2 type transport system permease protein